MIMKLRNKKTGEIIETDFSLSISVPDEEKLYGCDTYTQLKGYNSIAELNKEWEDCKELEDVWYIDWKGDIRVADGGENWECEKQIGNYFKTKEEAEKAVEKLKAWKRLKDKGFRFNRWTIPEEPKTPHIKLVIEAEMDVPNSPYDLDLLFGGEE